MRLVRRSRRPHPLVLADPATLEQVIANLLDNAIKYSNADQPVVVTARAERQWRSVTEPIIKDGALARRAEAV